MSAKQLSAGDYVASKCSKCKAATNHTIVAMVGDQVVRVECNTCGSVHNHRPVTAPSAPRTRQSTRQPAKQTRAEEAWQELVSAAEGQTVNPYRMDNRVSAGQFIQHPNFGLGRVVSTTAPDKMDVQFEGGIKKLRCKLK